MFSFLKKELRRCLFVWVVELSWVRSWVKCGPYGRRPGQRLVEPVGVFRCVNPPLSLPPPLLLLAGRGTEYQLWWAVGRRRRRRRFFFLSLSLTFSFRLFYSLTAGGLGAVAAHTHTHGRKSTKKKRGTRGGGKKKKKKHLAVRPPLLC